MPVDRPGDDELESGVRNEPTRQRSSIPSFLFVTFMLWLLTSHNGEEFLARHQYQDALTALKYQRSNFTAWLNGTESNFTIPEPDPTISPFLSHFLAFTGAADPSRTSYYQNITGFIHGVAIFHNITPAYFHNTTNASSSPLLLDTNAFMTTPNATNMTDVVYRLGTWDWLASDKVALSVVEKPVQITDKDVSDAEVTEKMVLVHGRIELTDTLTSQDLRLEFEGVHFIINGSIYGHAEPSGLRTLDVRQLPALVPPAFLNQTARLIEPELSARIKQVETYIDDGYVDQESTSDETTKTQCRFQFYGQVLRSDIPEWAMIEMEEELQKPTGIWTVPRPKLSVDGVLISKECGVVFEVRETEGLRSKAFFRRVTNYASLVAIMYLTLLILINRQVSRSRTPAGISRVSKWTFLSQAVIDSVSFAGHVTFAVLADGRPSLALVAPAFLACVLFVQEAQFSVLISEFQYPEDSATAAQTPPTPVPTPPAPVPPPIPTSTADPSTLVARTNPLAPTQSSNVRTLADLDAPTSTAPVTDTADSAQTPAVTYPPSGSPAFRIVPPPDSAPNPAPNAPSSPTPITGSLVAPPPNTPTNPNAPPATFWAFFFHHLRHDPQARLWLVFFFVLTFMIRIILSPTLALVFVACTYSCFWLPQIVRSVKKGRSSGLAKEYVLGVTLCRLSIFMYFLACPKNVLDVAPRSWSYTMCAFVCFQALIVLLQDTFGAAFFLPRKYTAEQVYDYHPPLPSLSDPEAGEQNLGDCAICMDTIRVRGRRKSIDEKAAAEEAQVSGVASSVGSRFFGKVGEVRKRRVYSLAPCHHLFHTECLERWLAIKNICPQCRRPLPPL